MNRRDAISRVALIMGGTVIGAEYFLSGCVTAPKNYSELFSNAQVSLLDEIGETIIPATKTPGAKAVHIGQFMAFMVKDCYNDKDQAIFLDGINSLNDVSKKKYSSDFMAISPAQRTELLNMLDQEQKAYTKTKKKEDPNHYFRMMKELTLLGYFTSKEGCTQALRYVPVPGKYDGCIDYKKGDKAWATS
ncbi:MAG: gluconate 2-dehydrogenase subunit 3 family protein [Bacteroidota bacterium]